jgi:hypothetical protein
MPMPPLMQLHVGFFKDKTFILISKIICFWTKKMFKFEWAALYN